MNSICAGQKRKNADIANQSPLSYNNSQNINDIKPIPSIVTISTSKYQKFDNAQFHIDDAMKRTCINRIIKLSAKAKNAKKSN